MEFFERILDGNQRLRVHVQFDLFGDTLSKRLVRFVLANLVDLRSVILDRTTRTRIRSLLRR